MSKKQKPEPARKPVSTPAKKNNPSKPGLEAINLSNESAIWKKVFWAMIPAMLLIIWVTGWNTAFHSDEMMYNQYEKENFKYYSSFGKDTSFTNFKLEDGFKVKPHLRTYGGFFDLLAVGTNKVLGIDKEGYEFNTRHLWIQLFGILAILFAGLIALELSGSYRMAIVTSLIVFLTPTFFGHSLLNSKDVPFAAGYTLGILGMVRLLKDLKNVKWLDVAIFALGLGCAMGTRVGGLLLICYLGLFTLLFIAFNKDYRSDIPGVAKSMVPKFLVAVLAGYAIAVLSWPFALMSPIKNVLYSLSYVSQFKENIPLTFEGVFTDCNNLPKYYLIKWMSMTVPTLFILLFAVSLVYLILLRRHPKFSLYLLLLFAVVFPVAYAWKVNAVVYSGWRHFLFIYPTAAVLMAIPVLYIQNMIAKPQLKAAFMGGLLLCLGHPIVWSIVNHPYEYIYYNEMAGGFKNNYYDYETETWQMSVKPALDWIYQQEDFKNAKDTVYIGTNAWSETNYLVKRLHKDEKTKVIQTGYKGFHSIKWDYCILNILFHPPYILKNSYPPYGTVHVVEIDGKPVCAVVKATPGRPDLEGVKAMQRNDFATADSLLSLYYQKDTTSESIMEYLMLAKDNTRKFNEALNIYSRVYALNQKNNNANYYAAIAYANTGQMVQARMAMNSAIEGGLQNREVFGNMAMICEQLKDQRAAQQYRQLAAQATQ